MVRCLRPAARSAPKIPLSVETTSRNTSGNENTSCQRDRKNAKLRAEKPAGRLFEMIGIVPRITRQTNARKIPVVGALRLISAPHNSIHFVLIALTFMRNQSKHCRHDNLAAKPFRTHRSQVQADFRCHRGQRRDRETGEGRAAPAAARPRLCSGRFPEHSQPGLCRRHRARVRQRRGRQGHLCARGRAASNGTPPRRTDAAFGGTDRLFAEPAGAGPRGRSPGTVPGDVVGLKQPRLVPRLPGARRQPPARGRRRGMARPGRAGGRWR